MCEACDTAKVSNEVLAERLRQNEKWGEQNHPNGTAGRYATLANFYREATDLAASDGSLTYRHILLEEVFEAMAEDDPAKLRIELIQVAAVAVQWVEAIDRGKQS